MIYFNISTKLIQYSTLYSLHNADSIQFFSFIKSCIFKQIKPDYFTIVSIPMIPDSIGHSHRIKSVEICVDS